MNNSISARWRMSLCVHQYPLPMHWCRNDPYYEIVKLSAMAQNSDLPQPLQ